jgi:hypothetical protein
MAKAVITVKRTGGTSGTVQVDYATSDGTATVAGGDYSATTGTLVFGPGVASHTFGVPIINDALGEGTEQLSLTLSGATGTVPVSIIGANPVNLSITDSEPTLQFSASKYSVAEYTAKAVIAVKRTSTSGSATASYSISGGTAQAGSDYTAASAGILGFAPGVATATFAVNIINDTVDEPAETVNLALSGGSLPLGTPIAAVLSISDNDVAGKAQFSVASYSVAEGGLATLTVKRSGGTSSGATVAYATGGGTATGGTNYTSTSGTLTFGAGQTSLPITVQTLDDLVAGNTFFQVTLTSPGGGLKLGTPTTADVWIVSN